MKELRAYLSMHGLTASAFAEMIGTSQPTVTRLLNGKRKPSPALALRIEKKTRGAVPRHSLRPDIYSNAA
jgi:DNA-binding transcriptional regulator YdaS (Cro superfamily)